MTDNVMSAEEQQRLRQQGQKFVQILGSVLTEGVSDVHFVGGEQVWGVKYGRPVKTQHEVTDKDIVDWATVFSGGPDYAGGRILTRHPSGSYETMTTIGAWRLRIAFRRQDSGMALTLRLVPDAPPSIDDAMFQRNPIPKSLVHLTLNAPAGLILAEGPTGSGKTSLIAALLNEVNQTQSKHIYTVEDPIEFVHRSKMSVISQREIGQHVDTFPNALRTSLRSRPNIILVGELLDLETVRAAIEAANKGHLVFATSHASSAEEGVSSLISQFPGSEQNQISTALSQALAAVVVQRLIPTQDGKLVPARELMLSTVPVRKKIKDGDFSALSQALKPSDGMWAFEDDLARLWAQGQIDADACLRFCNDRESMENKLVYAQANREEMGSRVLG